MYLIRVAECFYTTKFVKEPKRYKEKRSTVVAIVANIHVTRGHEHFVNK